MERKAHRIRLARFPLCLERGYVDVPEQFPFAIEDPGCRNERVRDQGHKVSVFILGVTYWIEGNERHGKGPGAEGEQRKRPSNLPPHPHLLGASHCAVFQRRRLVCASSTSFGPPKRRMPSSKSRLRRVHSRDVGEVALVGHLYRA